MSEATRRQSSRQRSGKETGCSRPARRDRRVHAAACREPGVYRVEIRASNRPRQPLWIVSNPIYVGVTQPAAEPEDRVEAGRGASAGLGETATLFPAQPFGWTIEHDSASRGHLDVDGGEMRFRFALGPDAASRPRVAIAAPPTPLASSDHVTLSMRADRPMRVSVQLRTGADGTREERWQRSVYVDERRRETSACRSTR